MSVICDVYDKSYATCLRSISNSGSAYSLIENLVGSDYTLDEQCQYHTGKPYAYVDKSVSPDQHCFKLKCRYREGNSIYIMTFGYPAIEGTYCYPVINGDASEGDGRQCIDGRCQVSSPANTSGANTSGVNTSGANTSGANTSGVNTSGANTSGANTSGANTSGINTSRVNTSGANTSGVNTSGVNTSSVNSSGVNTSGVNTSGANTSGANTSGANTSGVNTSGANTSGFNTSGVNTSNACQRTLTFHHCNISSTNIQFISRLSTF
ncbi:hypothetical protein FHG87_006539 [Trinorchestia longiramus]|nr:hypothetical protein FHG87_006539 [Trinorchestia longiramus]